RVRGGDDPVRDGDRAVRHSRRDRASGPPVGEASRGGAVKTTRRESGLKPKKAYWRPLLAAVAALALTLGAAACGEKSEMPVVAVAALVQRPLTSLIAIGRKRIHSAADLRGKRVGTAGIPYQAAYLRTILERAKVPPSSVKETSIGTSLLPAMLSGKVDAT